MIKHKSFGMFKVICVRYEAKCACGRRNRFDGVSHKDALGLALSNGWVARGKQVQCSDCYNREVAERYKATQHPPGAGE